MWLVGVFPTSHFMFMRRLVYILSLTIGVLLFIDREGCLVAHEGAVCGLKETVSGASGFYIDTPSSFGELLPTQTLSVPGISIASSNGGNSAFRTRKSLQERMAASFTSTSAASLTSFRTSFYFNPSGTHSRSRYAKLLCVLRL